MRRSRSSSPPLLRRAPRAATTQNVRTGLADDYQAVLADVRRRDHLDSTRAVSPLRAAVGCDRRRHQRYDRGRGGRSPAGVGHPAKWGGAMTEDGTWSDESDWEFSDSELRGSGRGRAGARRGDRGPAQCRQVDLGEPHHRPARSGGAGRPGRDAGSGVLRRAVDRTPVRRAGHRGMGTRRQRACSSWWPSRRRWPCAPPTR